MPNSHAAVAQPRLKRIHQKKPLPNVDALPPSALLNRAQVSELTGFSIITLKMWDLAGQARGPKVTRIEGWPRYRAGDVRAWLAGQDAPQ